MSDTIITGTVRAWITPHADPHRIESLLRAGKQQELVQFLNYTSSDMSSCGWIPVGTAQIALQLAPHDERVGSAIASLERQLQEERAESMQRQNAILDRISKLQALEYTA